MKLAPRPAVFIVRVTVGSFLLRLGARIEGDLRYEVTGQTASPGCWDHRPVPASWTSDPMENRRRYEYRHLQAGLKRAARAS